MRYEVLSTRKEIDDIIPKLIEQKLYLYKNWRMYDWYVNYPEDILKMSVCYSIKNNIIGVALHTKPSTDDINIAVFVKSHMRRRGIGTELVRLLNITDRIAYESGYRKQFWKKI